MLPYTGDYTEHFDSEKPSLTFYSFTPRSLMRGGMYQMDDELAALLIEAHRNIGFLEGLVEYAPNKEAFAELMLLKECTYSHMIDYDGPDLKEILTIRGTDKGNITPIMNLEAAYSAAANLEIHAPDLSQICGIALNGESENTPIDVRAHQTFWLGAKTNLKGYNPTAPDAVLPALADISAYVFLLKYELLKDETDPVDLLGLTALQVFEPSLYSKLPSYKDILCGADHSYSYERQKADEEKVKKSVSLLMPNDGTITNEDAANKILGILFPRTKTATGISYSIGRSYSHRDFIINNNIATPECFDRYFALTLENDAIPTSVMKHIIYEASEGEFTAEMMRLYREGKIVRLLEEIEAYVNREHSAKLPVKRAALIITALVSNWSSFEVDDRGFFSVPFAWRLLFCVDPLLKAMDSTARFLCIHSVFEDKDVQPSTLALLLQDFETQLGRFTEDSSIRDDVMFSLEEVLELEMIFKSRAIDAIDSGAALRQYHGLEFLWMLGNVDAELADNKKKSLVSDDISLVKVVSYCTSRGTVATKIVAKTRDVKRQAIGEFIDVGEAYRRIKAFAATSQFFSLPKDDQMNAIAFILVTERTPSESVMKDCIAEDAIEKALNQLRENATNE